MCRMESMWSSLSDDRLSHLSVVLGQVNEELLKDFHHHTLTAATTDFCNNEIFDVLCCVVLVDNEIFCVHELI